jgi:hypothetical protein
VSHGTTVARLVTVVDVEGDGTDPSTMSLSARYEAVLANGRRVLLLEGRGWTSTLMRVQLAESPGDSLLRHDASAIWAVTSIADIEAAARTVVGPDEPFGGHTREEIEAGHWVFSRMSSGKRESSRTRWNAAAAA